MIELLLLAVRGAVAVGVLLILAGGLPRLAQGAIVVGFGAWTGAMAAGAGIMIDTSSIVIAVVREIAIGATLGIAGSIPLLAAQTAGRLVDRASGNRGEGPYSALFGILAAAVFVGIDGPAIVIRAILESFRAAPPISIAHAESSIIGLVPAAVRLAIPWLVTAVVVEIAVGAGMRLASRAGIHAPVAAAVPAAIVMMTAALVGTLGVAIAALVRSSV